MPQQPTTPPPDAPEPEESFADKFWRWTRRASVAGAIATIAIHVCLGVIAALIAISRPSPPEQGPAPEIGVAVMTDAELTALRRSSVNAADPTPESDPQPQEEQLLPDTLPDPTSLGSAELDAPLESLADLGPAGGSGGGGDESSFQVTGSGGGGGAEFFGVEAEGSRFIFIIDISSSMRFGGKIERTRVELIEAINGLQQSNEFVVLLYEFDSRVLGGGDPRWVAATDRNKSRVRTLINRERVEGGTNPLPAFKEAFTMRPGADAIYFMTDGEFPSDIADQIIHDNRERKIPIHAIAFVSRMAEPIMQEIARTSGGTYTYIP